MFAEHHWRIPDRIYFSLAAFVVLLTGAFVGWSYSVLPTTLPIHFGPSGTPDAFSDNKILTLTFPVLLQFLLTFMISWSYRHPRLFHFPSRRRLESFPLNVQAMLLTLARHLLAMTLLLSTLIMSYISLGTVLIGLDMAEDLNPMIMMFLIIFLLLVVGAYTGWMRQVMREAERPNTTV